MPQITREVLRHREIGIIEPAPDKSPQKSKRSMRLTTFFLLLVTLLVVWGAFCFFVGASIGLGGWAPEVKNLIVAILEFFRFLNL